MRTGEYHRQLLSSDGMGRIRRALSAKYFFLLHKAKVERGVGELIRKLRQDGLLPSDQQPARDADMSCVADGIGVGYSKILCLRGPDSPPLPFNDGIPRIELAIGTAHLNCRIGVDWSFAGCWEALHVAHDSDPNIRLEETVVDLIRRFGSIAAYDPIPSSALRIRLESSGSDPMSWRAVDEWGENERAHVV
jgi:hypothetical protein